MSYRQNNIFMAILNMKVVLPEAELGPLLLKCNHYNYNCFDILAITITAIFRCNALHYNYFTYVIDNFISITSITLSKMFENPSCKNYHILILCCCILRMFHKISIYVWFYCFYTYRLSSVLLIWLTIHKLKQKWNRKL